MDKETNDTAILQMEKLITLRKEVEAIRDEMLRRALPKGVYEYSRRWAAKLDSALSRS